MEKIKFPTELEVRRVCDHVDWLYVHNAEEESDFKESPCDKCREISYGDEIIQSKKRSRGRPRRKIC
jgi:hypothetical protein